MVIICMVVHHKIRNKLATFIVFDSDVESRRHYDTFHKKYGFKCIYSGTPVNIYNI